MEGLRIELDYIGTAINPVERDIYETGKSVAWKTWHVSPHASTKVGRNKVRSYTNAYAPREYRKNKSER